MIGSVIQRHGQHVVTNHPEATDTIDRMLHVCSLQRDDWKGRLALAGEDGEQAGLLTIHHCCSPRPVRLGRGVSLNLAIG
jgi:hypothetical protein